MNDTRASREWATRPDDQRYLTLEDLSAAVHRRKRESWTVTSPTVGLRMVVDNGDLALSAPDYVTGQHRQLALSNWSFGQLAATAKAPASYLRRLPPELAAANVQWGLEYGSSREDVLIMGLTNGHHELRSLTSSSYGRIWDADVVERIQRVNADGRWKIPAASYSGANPKRATTLYASDRDVFLFLVDPNHPVHVGDDTLFRGFYCWNSEVGAATFGLTTFLYRFVCDNRIIWGQQDVREVRIRHTGGAPQRFEREAREYLDRYTHSSPGVIEGQITRAQQTAIPLKRDETIQDWLRSRGFTRPQSTAIVQRAQEEEGQAHSVWDIIQGATAVARSVPHTDDRVSMERKAGSLMRYAS